MRCTIYVFTSTSVSFAKQNIGYVAVPNLEPLQVNSCAFIHTVRKQNTAVTIKKSQKKKRWKTPDYIQVKSISLTRHLEYRQ